MRRRRRAMTLVEAQVAALLLFVLVGAMFWIYSSCASVFARADVHLELLAGAHAVTERLGREVERGAYDSCVEDDRSVSFLSPVVGGDYAMQPLDPGLLEWSKYVLFRFNSVGNRVEYREIELPVGDPVRLLPKTIPQWDGPDGKNALNFYMDDMVSRWSVVARNVYECHFDLSPDFRCVQVTMGLAKQRLRKDEMDRFAVRSTAAFRNSPLLTP